MCVLEYMKKALSEQMTTLEGDLEFSKMTHDNFMCYYRQQTDRIAYLRYELKWIQQRIDKLSSLDDTESQLECDTLLHVQIDYMERLFGEEMYFSFLEKEYTKRFGHDEDDDDFDE